MNTKQKIAAATGSGSLFASSLPFLPFYDPEAAQTCAGGLSHGEAIEAFQAHIGSPEALKNVQAKLEGLADPDTAPRLCVATPQENSLGRPMFQFPYDGSEEKEERV